MSYVGLTQEERKERGEGKVMSPATAALSYQGRSAVSHIEMGMLWLPLASTPRPLLQPHAAGSQGFTPLWDSAQDHRGRLILQGANVLINTDIF